MEISKRILKKIVRDENDRLLKRYDRMAEQRFMTRKDCLSIHINKHSPEALNGNGNGNGKQTDPLMKEKVKFWGAMVGLILVITTVLTVISSILIVSYFG